MNNKLAMIGCGGIGDYHLGHFMQYGDLVEMVGFCDLIPEKADRFVEKAGCGKAYTDFRVMLDETKPDMVFVCIPPYCHGDVERELLERNIHFFVEKPMSLDIKFAKWVRDEIEKRGLITAVGFQERYCNRTDFARDFCKENQIVFIDGSRIGGIPKIDWWGDKKLSGGQLVEAAIHECDLIRYCVGDVDEVFSYCTRGFVSESPIPYDTDDCTATTVKFKCGAIGVFAGGCYAKSGNAFASKVVFSAKDKRIEYMAQLDVYGEEPKEKDDNVKFVVKGDGALGAAGEKISISSTVDRGLICDRTFIEAVLTGDASKIRSPYADAYKTLAFVLACNESMATGKAVKVEY